jgi:hypothetical protein
MNINSIIIPHNYVLLQLGAHHEVIKTPMGLMLSAPHVNKYYNPRDLREYEGKYYDIVGKVLKVCQRLLFYKKEIERQRKKGPSLYMQHLMRTTMPWDCDIEVQEGDEVHFNYRETVNGQMDNRTFEIEGYGMCLFCAYDQLLAVNKNPVNGWLFIERILTEKDEITDSNIFVKEKGVQVGCEGIIRKVSKPIRAYIDHNEYDDDTVDLKPGDRIFYNTRMQVPLEYEYFQTTGLESFWKIRRKDIYFVLE